MAFCHILCYPLGDRRHDVLPLPSGYEMSEYLKTEEAAEFLGVSQNTQRNWTKLGKIPVQFNTLNN
ncbi:helix-turn-helix domain-containing protein [Gimesia benthica]|uniref:Helix-turn-helix domain-containing protein n=1 Tax=Gimesia benthica TaxID=2608982 RepID=A0A6I6A9A6_9PLAN|nr:helix-turn-helix domain-containing protein [Gimesia benthica]